MTVWEALFGTPERAAKALSEDGMPIEQTETCWLMDILGKDIGCCNCLYEYDRYGCERRDITLLEWLNQEVQM